MVAQWRDGTYHSQTSSTQPFTLTVPASVQTGDLGIFIASKDDGTNNATVTSSGWSQLVSPFVAGYSVQHIMYRFRQAGDSGTLSFASTVAMASWACGWFSGVSAIGAIGTPWVRSSSISTATASSITTTRSYSTVVSLFGQRSTPTGDLLQSLDYGTIHMENPSQQTGSIGVNSHHYTSLNQDSPGATSNNDAAWSNAAMSGWGLQVELFSQVTVNVWNGTSEVPSTAVNRYSGGSETAVSFVERAW